MIAASSTSYWGRSDKRSVNAVFAAAASLASEVRIRISSARLGPSAGPPSPPNAEFSMGPRIITSAAAIRRLLTVLIMRES